MSDNIDGERAAKEYLAKKHFRERIAAVDSGHFEAVVFCELINKSLKATKQVPNFERYDRLLSFVEAKLHHGMAIDWRAHDTLIGLEAVRSNLMALAELVVINIFAIDEMVATGRDLYDGLSAEPLEGVSDHAGGQATDDTQGSGVHDEDQGQAPGS